MTEQEERVLDLTVDLWEALSALPSKHPSDMQEYERDIHDIQNRVMAGVTARMYPERFTQGS